MRPRLGNSGHIAERFAQPRDPLNRKWTDSKGRPLISAASSAAPAMQNRYCGAAGEGIPEGDEEPSDSRRLPQGGTNSRSKTCCCSGVKTART
jgi:hypothetical protein